MSYARGILLTALAALAFITVLITSPFLATQLGAQGRGQGGAQAAAQPTRTVQDGVFSDAQATRGQALYAQRCAGCNFPALAGRVSAALHGERSQTNSGWTAVRAVHPDRYALQPVRWPQRPLGSRGTSSLQPQQVPTGRLRPFPTDGRHAWISSPHLRAMAPAATDFPVADAVNSQIGWPAGRGLGAGSAPTSTWYAPTGNLAQLMRGVFFHNSNLIFSIQEMEAKDLPPKPPDSRPDGLTTFDWGLMIYTGWRAVEQSATAIADASSLMMLPGLRCENGRAAPVTEPDWIRFTDRMVSVARRTYRLAQTKNKEALSEYTLDLSNACNACHGTYRDVGGRGRGGAGNTAGRCMHR